MRAGPALLLAILVVIAGCSAGVVPGPSPTPTPPPTASPTPDPSTVDRDADGLSLALERELGTSDNRSNERVRAVLDELDEGLTAVEKEFLSLAAENPHNIWPQIRQIGGYKDGEITTQEYRNLTDEDQDGLVRKLELEIGTNPRDPDTDADQLLDGWEYFGGVIFWNEELINRDAISANGSYHSLPGSDPLHKDLYILQAPRAGKYPENSTTIQNYIERYANAPVNNPDGENGIDIHFDTDEDAHEIWDKEPINFHPLIKTRYFLFLKSDEVMSEHGAGGLGGGGLVIISAKYTRVNRSTHSLLDHETMHNLVGKLDEEKQKPNDPNHPAEDYGGLSVLNPKITEEIHRDGMKGLEHENFDFKWRLPNQQNISKIQDR